MKEVHEDEAHTEQKPLALKAFGARRVGGSSRRAAGTLRRKSRALGKKKRASRRQGCPCAVFEKTSGLVGWFVKPERRSCQRLVSLL